MKKDIIYKVLGSIGPEGHRTKWLLKYQIQQGLTLGENTHYFSNVLIGEPYLVSIGSNSTVSANVCFLTHDASIGAIGDRNIYSDLCGKITVGNKCFIGYGSIILYGVSIPDNVIVAAGSVVTRSVEQSGVVIGGNPAKVICTVQELLKKRVGNMLSLHGKTFLERKEIILGNEDKLINKRY